MQAKKNPRLMVQKKLVQKKNPRFIVEKKHARLIVKKNMHAKLIVHTGPSVGPKKRRQARWIILTGPSVGPQTNNAGKVDRSHRAFMQAKKHPRLMVQKKTGSKKTIQGLLLRKNMQGGLFNLKIPSLT